MEKKHNNKPLLLAGTTYSVSIILNIVITLIFTFLLTTLFAPKTLSAFYLQYYSSIPALIIAIAILPEIMRRVLKFKFKDTYHLYNCGIKNLILTVIATFPALLLVNTTNTIFLYFLKLWLGKIPNIDIPMPSNTSEFIFALFLIAIFPAIFEELFMRGLILRSLEKHFKPITTIVIVGILFGIMHCSPTNLVSAAIFGVILAYLIYRTNSIIPSMIMHFTNNAFSITVSYLTTGNEKGVDPFSSLSASTIWGILPVIAISLLILLFIFSKLKFIPTKQQPQIQSYPELKQHLIASRQPYNKAGLLMFLPGIMISFLFMCFVMILTFLNASPGQ